MSDPVAEMLAKEFTYHPDFGWRHLQAPTWQDQRRIQQHGYDAAMRMGQLKELALSGVEAVLAVHQRINAINAPHPALENEMRELEIETVRVAKLLIRNLGPRGCR